MSGQGGSRRVTIFSLGGTIASTNAGASSKGVQPQLSGDDLIGAVPQVHEVADITTVSFRQVPSGHLTLVDMTALATEIERSFDGGADGVVVTQGTDTIEETSFALDLLVGAPNPVVVTGAMRNPTLPGADGPANLLSAVRVAASLLARNLGTLVVLNDEIHAARFVQKTHTSSPSTFQSVGAGQLGWVVEDRVRLPLRLTSLDTLQPAVDGRVPDVALIKWSLGDDGRILDQLTSLRYEGAVIEGFGGGHVPRESVAAIERLATRIPVVLASRAGSGEVLRSTYGYPGSETDLLSRGLYAAGALDGLKARILLSLILMTESDATKRRTTFDSVVESVSSFDVTN